MKNENAFPDFLDELEKGRGNGARSRNLRLTAIRSFYRYAAYEEPAQSGLIQRILGNAAETLREEADARHPNPSFVRVASAW